MTRIPSSAVALFTLMLGTAVCSLRKQFGAYRPRPPPLVDVSRLQDFPGNGGRSFVKFEHGIGAAAQERLDVGGHKKGKQRTPDLGVGVGVVEAVWMRLLMSPTCIG